VVNVTARSGAVKNECNSSKLQTERGINGELSRGEGLKSHGVSSVRATEHEW